MSIKTFSYFDKLERKSGYISPSGNGYIDEYQIQVNKETGEEELIKVGKRNVYEEIQAYKDSADITNIISRFVNGETELLHQVNGVYGDFTNAPTSYADYFAKVKEAEKIFNDLPDEIKSKFDYDAEKFFLEFGTDSFADKVSDPQVVKDSEVIREEFDNAE